MEPKKFFLKDFIQYVSPCFGCGKPTSFRIWFTDKYPNPEDASHPSGSIAPVVNNKYMQIDLSIQYTSTLKVWIFHKDNTFMTNDNVAFSHYIATRDVMLLSDCSCGCGYTTNPLDFQTFNRAMGAITLCHEYIVVIHNNTRYSLRSNFTDNTTVAIVSKIPSYYHELKLELPLIPRYQLKDRQELINKLDTYLLFS